MANYRRKNSSSPFDVILVIGFIFVFMYYAIKWLFKGIGWLIENIVALFAHLKKEKEIKNYEKAKANNVILIDGKGLKKVIDYTFTDEDEVLQKL